MTSHIRRGCCLSAWLVISLAGSSCAIIDSLGDSTAIKYPESGIYGLNILAPGFSEASGVAEYSFRAELEDGASLRVQVNTNTVALLRDTAGGSGWVVESGSNTFVALEGQNSPDIGVAPELIAQTGAGQLEIQYYENGDVTPTFTKIVDVTVE